MKNKTLLLCLSTAIIFFVSGSLFGQHKSFQDVVTVILKNMGPIMQGSKVKGYYMFYQTEKIDRKTNAYHLMVLDENLNKVGNRQIKASKNITLLEGSYNEKSILFKFFDTKEDQLSFHQYDLKGNLMAEKIVNVDSKYDQRIYKMEASTNELLGTKLFSVPGKGFLHYNMKDNKNPGYSIDFIPENGLKAWTYSSDPKSDEIEAASFATVTPDLLINAVVKKPSLMSRDGTYYLMGLDINTGEKRFEKKLEGNRYSLQILNSHQDKNTGNTILFGQYYPQGDKMFKESSLGIFSLIIDNSGNTASEKYVSWSKDIAGLLPVDQRGKIKDIGYLYFHKIIKNKKGEIFAIAEQYRKAADGAGIAVAALGGGGSVVKMVVEDLVVLRFTPDFTLAGVEIFEKDKTSISLPPSLSFMGMSLLGHYIKAKGWFDYTFTQMNNDETIITTGYLDFEKRKGEKNGWTFGAVTNSSDAYTVDKLPLNVEASDIRVMQAKHGYILVSEYYERDKKLDLRLEKINY